MLETPQIMLTAAQLTAVVRVTIPRAEIRNVMGPGLSELMAAVLGQGVLPTGAWFTHHLNMDPDIFDFEIGVPVPTPIAATGRVQPGELRATKVARANYRGPYEGLSAAWQEFDAWIAGQGLQAAADLWECYVVGPESGPDSAKWCTELNQPLLG